MLRLADAIAALGRNHDDWAADLDRAAVFTGELEALGSFEAEELHAERDGLEHELSAVPLRLGVPWLARRGHVRRDDRADPLKCHGPRFLARLRVALSDGELDVSVHLRVADAELLADDSEGESVDVERERLGPAILALQLRRDVLAVEPALPWPSTHSMSPSEVSRCRSAPRCPTLPLVRWRQASREGS